MRWNYRKGNFKLYVNYITLISGVIIQSNYAISFINMTKKVIVALHHLLLILWVLYVILSPKLPRFLVIILAPIGAMQTMLPSCKESVSFFSSFIRVFIFY